MPCCSSTGAIALAVSSEEAKRDRLLGVHSIIVFSGAGFRQSYERWAMVEGFIREEYAELWFKRFFCRE